MTRIAFQLLLFFLPFAAYAVWLHFAGHGWRAPERWRGVPLVWLVGLGVVCVLASFVLFGLTSGGSTRALYIPAHTENGVFVPGRIVEPENR